MIVEFGTNAVLGGTVSLRIERPYRETPTEALQQAIGSLRHAYDFGLVDADGFLIEAWLYLYAHRNSAQGIRRDHPARINGAILELYEKQGVAFESGDV